MPTLAVTYSRERLYAEVWSDPATTVAKRYSISGRALGKICDRLHVPMPKRGYWARRAVGKIDPTPPLPARAAETEFTVVRKGRRPDRDRVAESRDRGRVLMGPPIIVPERLERPHPLVASAEPILLRAEPWNGLLASRDEPCLDIAVSPPLLARALRIMNTLVLAVEERGLPVEVTQAAAAPERHRGKSSNVTRVLVSGEWVRFGIVEHLRQHQPSSKLKPPPGLKGAERQFFEFWNRPRVTLIPSGTLVLQIKEPSLGVRVTWRDERRPIEVRLNEFVKQLFVVADAKKQTREADCSWRESFDAESRRKLAERQRAAEEERRVASLRDVVRRWKEAREIRTFLEDIGLSSNSAAFPDEWRAWARGYADSIDPRVAGCLPCLTARSTAENVGSR